MPITLRRNVRGAVDGLLAPHHLDARLHHPLDCIPLPAKILGVIAKEDGTD